MKPQVVLVLVLVLVRTRRMFEDEDEDDKTMPDPKHILLIDAVTWPPEAPAESPLRDVGQWFRRHLTSLPDVQLRVLDAEADLWAALQSRVRGVIISGSPRDAWSLDPINARLCEFIFECRERHVPVLGVCYGHQILARALSGIVAPHPQGLELGNTLVELTPAGLASPLFKELPDRFEVLSSHADAVLELPPDCELLVRGDFTRVQGFHWKQRLFGVQFHPEHDPETLRFVWSTRRDRWRGKVTFDLDRVLDELRPTMVSSRILRNFVQQIVS